MIIQYFGVYTGFPLFWEITREAPYTPLVRKIPLLTVLPPSAATLSLESTHAGVQRHLPVLPWGEAGIPVSFFLGSRLSF